jgi:3-hydroxyisobutyrate dehydrogenase-like beta-hydroxyacid dehydrogenase
LGYTPNISAVEISLPQHNLAAHRRKGAGHVRERPAKSSIVALVLANGKGETVIGKVAFIGLGTMGNPMATNIVRAGIDVIVYDIREKPLSELGKLGAKIARSAKEAAEYADLVEVAVLDDAQVEAVLFGQTGVFAGARPGSIVAIHSTILPKTLKTITEIATAKDIIIVDAPISGGEAGAYQKKLCYMVGGSQEAIDKCRDVFATSGSEIVHLGDVGTGTVAKIINQILVCINMLAMFEGMSVAENAGLDLKLLQQILHNSAGQSYMADHWFERIERVSRSPEAVRHQWEGFYKTLTVALGCANDLGVALPGTALTQQLLARIVGYTRLQ